MKANIVYTKKYNRLDLFLGYKYKGYDKIMYIGDNIDDAAKKLHDLASDLMDKTIEITSIEQLLFTSVEEDVLVSLKSCFNKRYPNVSVSLNLDNTTQSQDYQQ